MTYWCKIKIKIYKPLYIYMTSLSYGITKKVPIRGVTTHIYYR